jgi:hypothetical protein
MFNVQEHVQVACSFFPKVGSSRPSEGELAYLDDVISVKLGRIRRKKDLQ